MYRRAQVLLIGLALLMGTLAVVAALSLDKKLADPEGFLGPSWLRLPLLLLGAFLLDMLPRALWFSRLNAKKMPDIVRERVRTHWTRERMTLVVIGLVSFYITYVSYRNLKSLLPFIMGEKKYDYELHLLDQALFWGHDPAIVLHTALGTDYAAHFLSLIYLWFLPLVPLAVTGWLIWSREISYGYWFVSSQVVCWTLGTASYYALPTLGPGFEYPAPYFSLAHTPTADLMKSLAYARQGVLIQGVEGAIQSVAGFASLHCGVTLLVALMVQHTIRNRVVHWIFWANFGVTIVATLYFGWHYVADDVAGILIALLSFYVGGVVSGQKFVKHHVITTEDAEHARVAAAAAAAEQETTRASAGEDATDPATSGSPTA